MTGTDLKKTPLFSVYERYGGKLIPFGEWSLPVSFSGIKHEHLAVRQKAGLFDVSHMGEIRIRGKGALDLLQKAATNDAARLSDGQAQYSALLNEAGGIIDDIFVYRLQDSEFLLCVNATNVDADFQWIKSMAQDNVEVIDETDKWAQLALQGPKAIEILKRVSETDPAKIARLSIAELAVQGINVFAARTGYTGEDGFELFVSTDKAVKLWETLIQGGNEHGLVPCGLGCRDTLRLEMGYPLHGHDITTETNPLEAGLGWIVSPDKGDFVGRQALVDYKKAGIKRKRVALKMRGKVVAREHYPILVNDKIVGEITSGTRTPSLEQAVAMGYVTMNFTKPGQEVQIEVRNKPHSAVVVTLPFYKA